MNFQHLAVLQESLEYLLIAVFSFIKSRLASSSSSFSHVDQLAMLNCAYVDACFVLCIIIVMDSSASEMVLGTRVSQNCNSELAILILMASRML